MKSLKFFAGLSALALLAPLASADTIIRYNTEALTGTQTASQVVAVDPGLGVTGVNVTRGAGLTASSAATSINASGWNNLEATDYFQFGFNTSLAYTLDTLTVGLRSSATGPGFMNLLYSRDGGAFTKLESTGSIQLVGTNFNNLVANLSEIGTVTSSLIFRLVVDPTQAVNAGSGTAIGSGGTFRFASYSPAAGVFLNPEITGSLATTAVPEPSSVLLAGLGAGVVAVLSLRRR